jgi:hypothetical protein
MREAVGIRVWNVFYEDRASNVRRMRAAVLLFCAAALVAGCGDDDEETTVVETTTTTTIETVPVPTEPDVTTPDQMGEDVVPEENADGDGDGAAEAPSKCGRIAFNPSTDSGAAAITESGTDCETARATPRTNSPTRPRASGAPGRAARARGCRRSSGSASARTAKSSTS